MINLSTPVDIIEKIKCAKTLGIYIYLCLVASPDNRIALASVCQRFGLKESDVSQALAELKGLNLLPHGLSLEDEPTC